jgi:PadR family transcriptional regulator PadR
MTEAHGLEGGRDPQLLKGVLPMLVLRTLLDVETYGYELVVRLREAGLPGLSTGTVYPVLSRLERDGLITARLAPSASGPARKYYRPTAAGEERLADAVAAWEALGRTVARVLVRDAPPARPDPIDSTPGGRP